MKYITLILTILFSLNSFAKVFTLGNDGLVITTGGNEAKYLFDHMNNMQTHYMEATSDNPAYLLRFSEDLNTNCINLIDSKVYECSIAFNKDGNSYGINPIILPE